MAEIGGIIFHGSAHLFDRLRIVGMVSKVSHVRSLFYRPNVQNSTKRNIFEVPVDSRFCIHILVATDRHSGSIRLWTLPIYIRYPKGYLMGSISVSLCCSLLISHGFLLCSSLF